MFKLVISDDEGKQTVVPLVRDEITVGRKEGNTIRLTERNVSRRHARLLKANGAFVVEDLHSYNGVKVNGQRIGAETKLEPGDQITIGDYQLALQLEAAAGVADAETAMIAAPGPPARVVMITPPAPGAEFALTGERARMGRAEDLDIVINHRSISREHAEIQKEPDGGLRLIDLGSANGVRVNNQDVQNALLEAGDVVELGQVRFRFVAAGEHYAFDADRTVQMDAVSVEPRSTGSKTPLLVAVAIVLFAVIGAVLVAFFSGEPPEQVVRPLDTPNVNENANAPDPFRSALIGCTEAVAAANVSAALEQATAALALQPGHEEAMACQEQARQLQTQEQQFNAGVALLDDGRLEEAYFQLDGLPQDSPFRNRPEVRRAVRLYAGMILQQTRMSPDPATKRRLAESVLAMYGITEPQRAAAEAHLEEAVADDTGTAVADADVQPTTDREPRRPRTPRPPRPDRQRDPPVRAPPPRATPDPPSAQNAEDEAVACSIRGDNRCVIRVMHGRARSARALGLLIEAYRATGQTDNALTHMRVYVQRFAGTSRARAYQQILSRHH